MRKLPLVVALLSVPAFACGGDSNTTDGGTQKDAPSAIDAPKPIDATKPIDAVPADAQAYDFSCLGSANPTTSSQQSIIVSGTAEALSLSGAGKPDPTNIELIIGNNQEGPTVLTGGSGSGSSGNFAFDPTPTNGSAVDLHLVATSVTAGEYRTNYVFTSRPPTEDATGIPVLLVKPSDFASLASLGAGVTVGSGQGAFGLLVSDCAGTPIGAPTISVKQGGSDVGTQFDVGSFAAQGKGLIFVFNVPPGDATVTTTVEGHTFRTRTITSFADSNTTTEIRP